MKSFISIVIIILIMATVFFYLQYSIEEKTIVDAEKFNAARSVEDVPQNYRSEIGKGI